jgi:hypothetical protein
MRAMSSRLLLIAALALAVALGILWYARRDNIQPLASTPAGPPVVADPPHTEAKPKSRVRRLTVTQRDELARQIAKSTAARTARKSSSAPVPARAPELAHESADPAVRKFNDRALEELGGTQTYLAECYDKHRTGLPPSLTVFSKVAIVTDPDIGAYVDAQALTDPDGKPLPAEFDACIRDMLQTFALPPLPPTDHDQFLLAFQLSFRDDD